MRGGINYGPLREGKKYENIAIMNQRWKKLWASKRGIIPPIIQVPSMIDIL